MKRMRNLSYMILSLTMKFLKLTWPYKLQRNFNLFRAERPKVMHLKLA
jgi:hypothetical protein